ncbi:hypothetical protein ABK046_48930, partial [Streptomyces caeruleatus]
DEELPDRNEIQIVAIEENQDDDTANDNDTKSNSPLKKRLSLGELDIASKDVKPTSIATTQAIDTWIDEYRNDPQKSAGAYAVISV